MNRRSSTSTKVFVGSLPPEATVDNLRKLFSPYGVVSECDIANRCGFLHLEDRELATKAIAELNNTQFLTSRISVEFGRSKSRRSNGPPPRNGNGKMRGASNSMGRNRGPYTRDFGGRGGDGPDRPGGYDRDYYNERNSVLTPIRNNDRSYNSYADRRDGFSGMSVAQNQSTYINRYSTDDRRSLSTYQTITDNGYSMGAGISGRRVMAGYNDTQRIATGGSAMYDDRNRSIMAGEGGRMYDDRESSTMNSGIMGERQGLIGLPQSNRMTNYGLEYTRRDSGQPKQLMSIGGYGDRIGSSHLTAGGYPNYSSSSIQNGGGYQMLTGGYEDDRQIATSGYSSVATGYGSSAGGYTSSTDGYSNAPGGGGGSYGGNYGDTYAQHGNYDNAYPAMSQQRTGYAAIYDPPSNYHY